MIQENCSRSEQTPYSGETRETMDKTARFVIHDWLSLRSRHGFLTPKEDLYLLKDPQIPDDLYPFLFGREYLQVVDEITGLLYAYLSMRTTRNENTVEDREIDLMRRLVPKPIPQQQRNQYFQTIRDTARIIDNLKGLRDFAQHEGEILSSSSLNKLGKIIYSLQYKQNSF